METSTKCLRVCCFMAFPIFLFTNQIPQSHSQTLGTFNFNLSDFKTYYFPCGDRRCRGFVQFCEDGFRCSYCNEDFCKSESTMPGQCQVMCRLLGYPKGSKHDEIEDKNTEVHSYVTQEFLSDPKDDIQWKVCTIVTSSLLGMVLIFNVLYFCWVRRVKLKKAIEEALAKWKPEPIISNPTPDDQPMLAQNQSLVSSQSGDGYSVVMQESESPRDDEETKELHQ